jgi:hypothetical protein
LIENELIVSSTVRASIVNGYVLLEKHAHDDRLRLRGGCA